MCRIEDCKRHELWGGMCRDHLMEALNPKPKRKSRKKKVDAVEVVTTDATDVVEERNDDEVDE